MRQPRGAFAVTPVEKGRNPRDHRTVSRTQCVQEIGRKRAKILVKYDDALGRRAKVKIGKSQDRLHRHGMFSISAPIGHRSRRRCQHWSNIADFVIILVLWARV